MLRLITFATAHLLTGIKGSQRIERSSVVHSVGFEGGRVSPPGRRASRHSCRATISSRLGRVPGMARSERVSAISLEACSRNALGDLLDQLRVTVKSSAAGSTIFSIGGGASRLNMSSERVGTNLSMVAKSSVVLIGFET